MNKQSPQGFNPLRGLATVLCFFAIFLVATHFFWNTEDSPQYSYADIRALFEAEQVKEVVVEENAVTLTLREPLNGSNTVTYQFYSFQLFYQSPEPDFP